MPGLLVPQWYQPVIPGETEVLFVTFLWGFTMALSLVTGAKALRQTYRSWLRRRRWNAYIAMVWAVWLCDIVIAIVYWIEIEGWIEPSFYYFAGILVMWTIQLQCLTQIMTNRISLVLYDPDKARRLRVGVALAIGAINISVFIVWIPARLQISHEWIVINNVWDRIEKVFFLFIDLFLNVYFMWLVKIKLIASGLTQYKVVYRCNLAMVCLSISADIAIICSMAAPVDTVYIEAHAVAYMVKLYIEMNLAELLGKVIKRSNQQRNSCTAADGWHPDPTRSLFNREWRNTGKKILQPTGGQMHSLNTDKWKDKGVDHDEVRKKPLEEELEEDVPLDKGVSVAIPCQAHNPRGSITSYMDPSWQRSTCGTTTRLTPADEAGSSKSAFKNMERQAFQDWPNEAGFDGLTEHCGPIELKVEGTIPAWAAGSLYRTGPGQCKIEDTKVGTFNISHWFDGLAHTHRFDIVAEGPAARVYYSSRRQSEKVEADIKATGTLRSISFAQKLDPCVGMFGKFMSVFNKRSDLNTVGVTVNTDMPSFKALEKPVVDVQGHRAASVVIGTDAAVMCEIDPKTMEPITFPTQTKFHPDLKGPLGGAHGKTDPETGDYFNYNLDLGKQPVYRIFRVNAATGKTDILATIPYKAAYIHSFFLTNNYVVLCIPISFYDWSGLKMLWKGNLLDSMRPFDPSAKTHWFVIDRRTSKGVVGDFTSPSRFFFHTVNAFEDEEGDIFCEVVDYPNRYIIDCFYYDVLLNRNNKAKEVWTDGQSQHKSLPRLTRYRLRKGDFGSASATADSVMEIPAPHAGDMPVINPNYRCRKHRYGYFLVSRGLSTFFDAIVKIDTETREVLQWEGPRAHTPGEAIFVPRPAADGETVDEDDGVLLSVVLDGENRTSYLLCLDAKTMTELGSAECQFAVAIGLHGRHLSAV
ncbi:hypothetical protein OQA88_9495 [Cercophora sp. LCS_1]